MGSTPIFVIGRKKPSKTDISYPDADGRLVMYIPWLFNFIG